MLGKRRSQTQRAGSESIQVQAAGDVILGVSEERAREISRATAKEVIDSYSEEAHALIQERIFKLDDRVIASLVRSGRMDAFADPGFQRTYKKAQIGAASTERDSDYGMLAALLADRADRGSERTIRAGIERAIEIADQVDDEALRALTVFQAVQQYAPISGSIEAGLDALEGLFEQLLDGPLPSGKEWSEHLDILDAVRVSSISDLRKFNDYYLSRVHGYCSPGRASPDAPSTITGTEPPVLWSDLVIPHELKPGFVRIAAPNMGSLKDRIASAPEQVQELAIASAKSEFAFEGEDPDCRSALVERFKARPSLGQIVDWWDSIPRAVNVTSVGRVLARANAERLDHGRLLPALD